MKPALSIKGSISGMGAQRAAALTFSEESDISQNPALTFLREPARGARAAALLKIDASTAILALSYLQI